MCSFYNPNIQKAFDEDSRDFVRLKDITLAEYSLLFRVNDGCVVRNTDELRANYQISFICFYHHQQQVNLKKIDASFPLVLADVALDVMSGRVHTFGEYIFQMIERLSGEEKIKALYTADKIQDFIELLVYSDIAGKKPATCERDFTKIVGVSSPEEEYPVFYSLFERLKLYDYLKQNMQLVIDRQQSELIGREVILILKIKI